MVDPIIRPMEPDEAEATARLWQASQRAAYTWFREDQRHPLDEAIAFFCDSICARCNVWVAVDGDRVIGMMALDGDSVADLFIDPDHWKLGIGSRLLALAKELNPGGLRLVTLQKNARARRFYEERGFVATEFDVSPPPENEPGVHYEWKPDRSRSG